jgi:hypothetical protein
MKKLVFLISFILITLTCFPQLVRVVLKSRVSMVKMPYDSVQIMNLRTGDKWVKIYPDTILSSSTVGIDNPIVETSSFEFENNYPNPIVGSTTVTLNTIESGNLVLSLYDILGRKCSETTLNCEPGIYKFKVSPSHEGIYILQAKTAKQKISIKLIQSTDGDQSNGIELESSMVNQTTSEPSPYKDDSNHFVIGDSLSFVCWKNGNTKSGSEKIDRNGYIFFNIFPPTTGSLDLIGYWGTLPGSFPMEPIITTITNIPYQNYVHFVNDSLLTTTRILTLYNTPSGWFYAGVGETWGLHYTLGVNGFYTETNILEPDPFGAYDVFNIELYTNDFLKIIYVGSVSKNPPPPEGSYDYFVRFP